MTESLRQPMANLRDALRAAAGAAADAHAPSSLRSSLTRSVDLLDRVLSAAAAFGPNAAMRLGNWTYAALAQANEALTSWHTWLEEGRPSEADLV